MQYERLSDFARKGPYLLFGFPLYTKVKINTFVETKNDIETIGIDEEGVPDQIHHVEFLENTDVRYLKMLVTQEKNFYHYCPFCKKELQIIGKNYELESDYLNSTITTYTDFSITEEIEEYEKDAERESVKRYAEFVEKVFDETGTLKIKLECTSKEKHQFYTIFQLVGDNRIMKTGQYPSILDFDNTLKAYSKILKDKSITKEIYSAEKLKTQNMGVGALLYLRRIFEKLIFEKYEQTKLENNIDEQTFREAKTKEKVELLHKKGFLPDYMADTVAFVYPILSKGIHQLEEEECNSHYPTLREAILLILKEKADLEKVEKSKKVNRDELNNIHSNFPK